jgi:predicted dehydrogenase
VNDTTLDVGVVGVGHLGRHHARLYAAMPGVRLVGVADLDRDRAAAIAAEYGCEPFGDASELCGKVQAASVAVPTAGHLEAARTLLEGGADVLVEKPLARSLSEARAINEIAERRGKLVMVGHTERFNPAVRALAAAVNEPRFLEIHRLAGFSARSTDIDVVLDLMIHDLDLLLYLDGSDPVEVDAVGIRALTDQVDIANARVRLASGCVANLTASRISAEPLRRLRVFQDRTYLSGDTGKRTVERYRLVIGDDGTPRIDREQLPVEDGEPLGFELQTFVQAVRSRVPPDIDGRQGQRVVEFAERVLESIRANAKPA